MLTAQSVVIKKAELKAIIHIKKQDLLLIIEVGKNEF